MKKTTFAENIALFIFIAFIAAACGNKAPATDDKSAESMKHEGHDHAAQEHAPTKAATTVKNGFDEMPAPGTTAFCPVMETEFKVKSNSPYSEYKGKTYVFCCPGCKPAFDADPEKYIKKM